MFRWNQSLPARKGLVSHSLGVDLELVYHFNLLNNGLFVGETLLDDHFAKEFLKERCGVPHVDAFPGIIEEELQRS